MNTNASSPLRPFGAILFCLVLLMHSSIADPVSSYWMELHGFSEKDLVFDFDNDGYPNSSEFFFGTDPMDVNSMLDPSITTENNTTLIEWDTVEGVAYQLEESADIGTWNSMGGSLLGTGETFEMEVGAGAERGFYRFTPVMQDSDGDCLSDFEEIHYTNTDPNDADSDDDGISDGDEVKTYRTDPNFASPTGRGTIRGSVVNDDDGDPATRSHPGIANWTVFLDIDLNGKLDPNEPTVLTAPDGSFAFEHLDPGFYRVCASLLPAWVQVFPETDAPYTADGFPDAVAEVVDSGNGTLAMPYGINKQSEVERKLVVGLTQEPVDPSIVLGQTPPSPYTPPIALWSDVDFMGISQGSHVTLEFTNEEIIDGPGIDLVVASLDQPAGERALIYAGRTLADMALIGTFDEGGDIGIDLGTAGIAPPVHFVKVEALDSLGDVEGFDLLGMKAVNFQPPPRGHYDVTIVGGDEVTGIDFGVRGVDRPPHVFVHSVQSQVLEGGDVTIKVTSSDDLGIVSQSLKVNGSPVTLNGDGEATYTTNYAGILYVEAKAEDTNGQEAISQLQLLVLNADGSTPDLSGLGIEAPDEDDAPTISIVSPIVGEILDAPSPIVGSITPATTAVSDWCVEYASTSLVDPEELEAADPDYILLAQGSGNVINRTLASFPADTVAPDTYLIRIKATGGTTRYLGFVVAVGLEELDIRPDIEITSPETVSDTTYLTDIVGSITTRQTLREWSVECVPLAEVNLDDLGDNTPNYKEFASGTNPVTDDVLGAFDPTVLANDVYLVRITAWNTNGLGWTDGVIVNVTGEAKLGNFALEFTDVSLPCAGIPIEVKRVYDTLNADKQGDFGYGWRLGVQDADIKETVAQTGSAFLATPFQVGTRVYLNTPEGKRVGFTFDVEKGPSGFLGTAYSAKFIPDPGVQETLEVPGGDTAFLSVAPSGEVSLFFVGIAYNPDTYILTDTEGLRYTYDQFKGLIEIEDPNGNKVLFSDDGIEHTAGPSIDFARDTEGRITSITGPTGQVWQYHYDGNGDLTGMTYPTTEAASFSYENDPAHYLSAYNDPFGQPSQTIEYDADGRVSAIVDAEGNRQEQNWNPAAFSGTYTDGNGNITTLEYDNQGNITRQINPPGGGEILYEYNDPNDPFLETAIIDANGNKTTYAYDPDGNLIERIKPIAGYVTRWEYDANGNMTKVLPAQGLPAEIEYDPDGNPILYRLGSTLREYRLSYTSSGLVATQTDPEGGLTIFEYDGPWTHPSKTTFPDGSTELVEFDSAGAPIKVTDRAGAETTYAYDAMYRVIETTDAAGGKSSTRYYKDNLPASQTDRLNRTTTHTYYSNDLLERVTLHDGTETQYEYDGQGNRTAVIDSLSNRTEYTYDANNRLIDEQDPNGLHRTHQYDLAGNRIVGTDRNGRKRTFIYDALNRMTAEHWHDPSDDSVIRTIDFAYDKLDRMTEASDPDATIIMGWPGLPASKMTSEKVTYPGRSAVTVSHQYDNLDSRTRLGYSGSLNAVRYVRDASGRAAIVKLDAGFSASMRWEQDFNGRGDITSIRRFDSVTGSAIASTTDRAVDPRGWLNQVTHRNSASSTFTNSSFTYTRNAGGGITNRTHGSTSISYGYDGTGQLTSADSSASAGVEEEYHYDDNGNRLSSHIHASYTVNTGNRLSQAGDWMIDYDGEGNMTRKTHNVTGEVRTYVYDYRNRLTKVTKQASLADPVIVLAEYLYDALDRRTAVIKSSQTLWTYYANEHPFIDYLNSDTDIHRMHAYGDKIDSLLGMWHRTHGSLSALTDNLETVHQWLDQDGNAVGEFEYDSFGNIINSTGIAATLLQPVSYTGRLWDADTELYYYRARYYDANLGRFMSEDPIGFAGDHSNSYRYVDNAPLIGSDPSGELTALDWVFVAAVIIIVITGIFVSAVFVFLGGFFVGLAK